MRGRRGLLAFFLSLMPARTRKHQKMKMRVKKRHRTPPYESEKVAKKKQCETVRDNSEHFHWSFCPVSSPCLHARIPQWLKFGFGFWTPAKNLLKYVPLRQQKNIGQRAHQRYDASFVHWRFWYCRQYTVHRSWSSGSYNIQRMKSLGLSRWKNTVSSSGPKIAHSEEVLQVRCNNVRHEMKGIQRHPPPIFYRPRSFPTELNFIVAKGFEGTLFYRFTIFYLICALLYCWRNFKSVFGSEDFVIIAKKIHCVQKNSWNSRKHVGQYMSKSKTIIYTLIIRRWPRLWIFNGILAAKKLSMFEIAKSEKIVRFNMV